MQTTRQQRAVQTLNSDDTATQHNDWMQQLFYRFRPDLPQLTDAQWKRWCAKHSNAIRMLGLAAQRALGFCGANDYETARRMFEKDTATWHELPVFLQAELPGLLIEIKQIARNDQAFKLKMQELATLATNQ